MVGVKALVRLGIFEADDTDHLRQLPVQIRVEPRTTRFELHVWSLDEYLAQVTRLAEATIPDQWRDVILTRDLHAEAMETLLSTIETVDPLLASKARARYREEHALALAHSAHNDPGPLAPAGDRAEPRSPGQQRRHER